MASELKFRNDVQALRGIAVGLVVLEHATDFFPGGFVGVDVFFVISGFVITRLLLHEFSKCGSLSLRDFYVRRARRLLPALTVVLISTLILSVLLLSPGLEQDKAGWAALSSFFFVANLRYILEGGYFFLQSDPFRHLWSLGVEEQFYAIYPVLFILLVKISQRLRKNLRSTFAVGLVAVSLVSLTSSSILAVGGVLPLATRLSFFGTPFRLWELLVGAVVAVLLDNRALRVPRSALVAGQMAAGAAVLWPALAYGPFTVFPGVTALPPVLGTALLIVIGSAESDVRNLGSVRPLIYLGNISYGLYLWHWPLLVFSERLFPESSSAPLIAVALSILLSDRQLKLLENPIRQRSNWRAKQSVLLVSLTTVAMVVSSSLLFVGSRSGLGLDTAAQFESVSDISGNCTYEDGQFATGKECINERQGGPRILLIGDSQARSLFDSVISVSKQLGASYRLAYGNSCPVHLRPNEIRPSCGEIQSGFKRLVDQFAPSVVVVANASDLYVSRGGFGKPDTRIRKEDGSLPINYQEALSNWVAGVRGALQASGLERLPIIYVQMVPPAPTRSPTLLQPKAITASFSLDKAFDRNIIVAEERIALSTSSNVTVFDPADVLCPSGQCVVAATDGPIYADAYHLNARGAGLLVPELARLIKAAIG